MPSSKKPRRAFRPSLDRLEPVVLLSGASGVVDLKGTAIGRDINRAVLDSTSKFRRDSVSLASLTVDPQTHMIRGGAVVTYKIPVLGSVTSTVVFRTSIDRPRPRDVKISLSKFGNFVSGKDRQKVSLAVARMIQKDHDQIVAAMQESA